MCPIKQKHHYKLLELVSNNYNFSLLIQLQKYFNVLNFFIYQLLIQLLIADLHLRVFESENKSSINEIPRIPTQN